MFKIGDTVFIEEAQAMDGTEIKHVTGSVAGVGVMLPSTYAVFIDEENDVWYLDETELSLVQEVGDGDLDDE